jgi:capsular polysaccharide biosynthesis protein
MIQKKSRKVSVMDFEQIESDKNGLQWLDGKCIFNRSLFHFHFDHFVVQELYRYSLMVDFINNIN